MLRSFFRKAAKFAALAAIGGTTLILSAPPAMAHETRQVGEYEFVVGWWTEPAFANQPNGPEVTISRAGKPVVEGVALSVDVIFGEETTTYELEPAFVVGVFGEPGNYNADLVPTRPGTWTYRIYGTVEDLEVDETFTSGPETFGDIEDPAENAFPVADPNNAELSERIETESDRVAEFETQTEEDVSSARTLGLIGLIVGVVGLVAAVTVGILTIRKRGG
ncbi:MAG TPA: hypothetical protein VGZ50_05070 [Actinomycetota bacterium]|nr:hypothetical protein [Actinomycetota bacterium]